MDLSLQVQEECNYFGVDVSGLKERNPMPSSIQEAYQLRVEKLLLEKKLQMSEAARVVKDEEITRLKIRLCEFNEKLETKEEEIRHLKGISAGQNVEEEEKKEEDGDFECDVFDYGGKEVPVDDGSMNAHSEVFASANVRESSDLNADSASSEPSEHFQVEVKETDSKAAGGENGDLNPTGGADVNKTGNSSTISTRSSNSDWDDCHDGREYSGVEGEESSLQSGSNGGEWGNEVMVLITGQSNQLNERNSVEAPADDNERVGGTRARANKRFPCSHCGNVYRSKNYLKSHINFAHSDDEAVKFKCKECSKIFIYKYRLKAHIEATHDRVLHPCQFCPKVFCNLKSCKLHEKLHVNGTSEIVPFACEFCEKKYLWEHDLKLHVRKHHTPNVGETTH